MGQKELSELADKLLNDSELRAQFTKDPEAAAKQAGITLDDEDHKALRDLGVHQMDESELVARISKRDSSMSR
jgi:1,2-phenylacetyl-CoA epoxidase catalytic subunit